MFSPRASLRLLAGAVLAVAFLSAAPVAQAVSCSGAAHQLTLSAGSVSPGSGTTATTFVFRVTYTDNANCAPTSIVVNVQGVGSLALQGSGTAYEVGVIFSRSMVLPAGTHGYSFTASSGSGPGSQTVTLTAVSPSTVNVTNPTPPPTPVPTPVPTPRPTPRPTPVPTPSPSASPSPTAPPTAGGSPSASPDTGSSTLPSPVVASASGVSSATPLPAGQGPGSQSSSSGGPFGSDAALVVWVFATLSSLVLFVLLTDRGSPPWLAGVVSRGEGDAQRAPAVTPAEVRAQRRAARGDESTLPRWLRPSVQAARFARPGEGRAVTGDELPLSETDRQP